MFFLGCGGFLIKTVLEGISCTIFYNISVKKAKFSIIVQNLDELAFLSLCYFNCIYYYLNAKPKQNVYGRIFGEHEAGMRADICSLIRLATTFG